ncbi:hypothetical protein LKF67_1267 [Lactococcus lactis subsp. lactis]|uniref:hypothetical protein n=1 Tax=Lactococcus lactis TaxID=1358 RepID=UPI00071DFCA6|nr:hypothetical protein [Lactococcus lactis]KST91679.1 hypothetical protein LKF67_1267 [Lactococcus lactis subsp. lactis]
MNIIEATKKALVENKAITNPESSEMGLAFVPTNSETFGILVVPTESGLEKQNGIYKEKWSAPGKYWNPKGTDILRNDWRLL